jgi:hypothetical protein
MDALPSWVGSGKQWLIAGFGMLLFSALIGIVSYVSFPPVNLMAATGTVVSVNHRNPSRSPKLNIFIDNGQGVLHLYTDLGVVRSKIGVGDVVQAKFEKDIFGRNFYRMWDLRRSGEILLSQEKSFSEARIEARQIGRMAFFIFAVSVVVIAIGAILQLRFRQTS